MKIHFKTLDYQLDSVSAVVDCFLGQPKSTGVQYTIDKGTQPRQLTLPTVGKDTDDADDAGFKNAPLFDTNDILNNIREVQNRAGLPPSETLMTNDKAKGKAENLTSSPLNLNIEMETGTGKTYCYIRTMFELNKRYGWSKFIVVVPSIAIREGVHKSFSMMAEHFLTDYGKKARFFTYDSSQLHHLESFSSDGGINVMIINVQAFNTIKEGANNKTARKIYAELDEFQSRRPIDVIRRNNPILILDEPQKMQADNTLKALANFNPLFILRYSATHKRDYNLVHRLDALDAYNQKLVKRITVKGIETKGLSGTHGYLYLQDILVSKKPPVARLEIEVITKTGFKRVMRRVSKGDDLSALSGGAEQYSDRYVISEIDARDNSVHFTNGTVIYVGQALGQVDEKALRTIQIRETIKAHIEKEKALFDKGIKVLSLFFIDEVAKYRQYDENGEAVEGEYARIFREQYQQILSEENLLDLNIENDAYKNYLNNIEVEQTHAGYFSVDKKSNRLIDPKTKSFADDELGGKTTLADDVDAYDLILKDKESLLAFPDKNDEGAARNKKNVRFLFSHSALREGWDNPNVFVICTLKHSDNVISRRQEVGRGLRLAVNRDGERMDANYFGALGEVHKLNELTVVTNESYTTFVSELQDELAKALASRPTKATPKYYEGKTLIDGNGEKQEITTAMANQIYKYLIKNDYVDDEDSITPKFNEDKESGTLAPLPETLQPFANSIHTLTGKVLNPSTLGEMVGNDNKRINNPINQTNLARKEFQALWSKINQKAIYQIEIDTERLITESVDAIDEATKKNDFVEALSYTVRTGKQSEQLSKSQVDNSNSFDKSQSQTEKPKLSAYSTVSYDLVGDIAKNTELTRKTVVRILQRMDAGAFSLFKNNPEAFIRKVSDLINEKNATMLLQSLTYHPTEERYLENEVFVSNDRIPSDALKVDKHVWEYVVTDSATERQFAKELEGAVDEVVVYAKLPDKFQIPTPFGNYNPDWAIAFNKEKVRHVYFVAETKGTMDNAELRDREKRKIDSAKKFFSSITPHSDESPIQYDLVNSYEKLRQIVGIVI